MMLHKYVYLLLTNLNKNLVISGSTKPKSLPQNSNGAFVLLTFSIIKDVKVSTCW